MNELKLAIGADHAGFDYKVAIAKWLNDKNLKDFGTYAPDSVDYPDFAHPVASAVENGEFDFGILICGSANGSGAVQPINTRAYAPLSAGTRNWQAWHAGTTTPISYAYPPALFQ